MAAKYSHLQIYTVRQSMFWERVTIMAYYSYTLEKVRHHEIM